jgi:cellulose synthase/poly-beta-1,6-N-acetylglucosamine synthase-like glycosyltransferase
VSLVCCKYFISVLIFISRLLITLKASFGVAEGMLNRWFRLHLQSLAPANPHWARVVGYGPFSLCVIHNEDLCPSSGDINRLMMMMRMLKAFESIYHIHLRHFFNMIIIGICKLIFLQRCHFLFLIIAYGRLVDDRN